jgi:hypothetical protein
VDEAGESDNDAPPSSSLRTALMEDILPVSRVGHPTRLPDCVLHDCMIRDEEKDLPGVAKCTMKGGVTSPAVSCPSTYSETVRKNCFSTFFEPADPEWATAASKLTEKEMCSPAQTRKMARLRPSSNASSISCVTFGADHGQICNANDMARIGHFVRRWGTHFVDSAAFGGQMEIQVQLRKNRDAEGGGAAGHRATEEAIYKAAPPHSPVMDLLADDLDGSGAGGDGGDTASTGDTSTATRLNTLNTIAMTEAAGNGKVLDHVHRHGGSSRDYDNGVEEVAVSFLGGTSTPPSSVETSHRDVLDWSKSIGRDPALLPTNILLRPMTDLLHHPSVEVEIARRGTVLADKKVKGGKKADGWKSVKIKEISRLRGVIKRKVQLLRNHLRWFLAKSERMGTLDDEAEQMKTVMESRLHHLRKIAREFAARVTRGIALNKPAQGGSGADQDAYDGGRDATGERLGKIALGGGDKIVDSSQQKASHAMIEYVLAYRDGLNRFDTSCHAYCEKKKDAQLVLGQMYGKFRVGHASQHLVPQGRSGDNDKLSITDAGFSLKRSYRRCQDECAHKKEVIAVSAKEMEAEERVATMNRGARSGAAANTDGGVMVDLVGIDTDGMAVDAEGGALFDFSSRAFFTGVDSVCKVCNGIVTAVATSMVDQDAINAREICANGRMSAFMKADAFSLARPDVDFDTEPDYTAVGDNTPLSQFSSSICLGVVVHLEEVLARAIKQHGLMLVARPRLHDLLKSWVRHSSAHAPRAVAAGVCRRFVKCAGAADKAASFDEAAKALAEKAATAHKDEENELVRLKKVMEKVAAAAKGLKTKGKDNLKAVAPIKKSLDEKLAVLKKKVAAEKALIAKTKANQKAATKVNKEVEKEDKTVNDFCKFQCLAQTPWGKADEKAHPYAANVLSEDRINTDAIARHGNRPCGKVKWPKRKGKCATCSSLECVAQARYDCFLEGRMKTGNGVVAMQTGKYKPVACDSRYVMLDGQYIDAKFPVFATTSKEMQAARGH